MILFVRWNLDTYHFMLTIELSHIARKPVFRVPTKSDTNRAAQHQKVAKCLKFCIKDEEGPGTYYLCDENKKG